jgi:hypothetical protein
MMMRERVMGGEGEELNTCGARLLLMSEPVTPDTLDAAGGGGGGGEGRGRRARRVRG